MKNKLDIQDALVVIWTANLKLKQESLDEYNHFLDRVMLTYDIEKNDLLELLSLSKKEDVMDALMLVAKCGSKSD